MLRARALSTISPPCNIAISGADILGATGKAGLIEDAVVQPDTKAAGGQGVDEAVKTETFNARVISKPQGGVPEGKFGAPRGPGIFAGKVRKNPSATLVDLCAGCVSSHDMDWSSWTPRERANLCFILKNQQLLLIRKKRGLGAGKINAPGGKIEPGETALQSAIRETQEEVGVTPLGLEKSGELFFQFADGYSLHCTVFMASDLEGDPVETAEADPFWVHCEAVPYEEMWEDDQHWLPAMLEGKSFVGYFTFDGDRMLSRDIRFECRDAAPGGASGAA